MNPRVFALTIAPNDSSHNLRQRARVKKKENREHNKRVHQKQGIRAANANVWDGLQQLQQQQPAPEDGPTVRRSRRVAENVARQLQQQQQQRQPPMPEFPPAGSPNRTAVRLARQILRDREAERRKRILRDREAERKHCKYYHFTFV